MYQGSFKVQIFLLHHAIIDCVSGALLCVLVVFCLAGFVALFFPQVETNFDILKGTFKTPELGIPKWTSKTPELGILKWTFKTPELIGILDFVLLDSNSEAGVRHHRGDHLQSLHRLWHSDDDGRQPQGRSTIQMTIYGYQICEAFYLLKTFSCSIPWTQRSTSLLLWTFTWT